MAGGWRKEALRPAIPEELYRLQMAANLANETGFVLTDRDQQGANGGPELDLSTNAAVISAANQGLQLSVNGTLREREWIFYDKAVIDIARDRLVVTKELFARGLTYPLPNALGVMSLEWETISDLEPAEVTMSGISEASKDQFDYEQQFMPIPMIHKEFTINLRTMEAARRNGRNPDTTAAMIATRKVAEMVEQIIFTGMQVSTNNGQIYGLTNHPNRNTGSVSGDWHTSSGVNIINDVLAMLEALWNVNMYGPYLLLVPGTTGIALNNDYKTYGTDTIMERIMNIPQIAGILPTNRLTGTNIVLVQLSQETIEMVDGIQPTMVEWDSRGGFEMNYKVICIMIPRIRATQTGQSGIAHFS
jgi:uncharacterized linocin/CFP29 family protein